MYPLPNISANATQLVERISAHAAASLTDPSIDGRWRAMFDALPAAIYVTDAQGRLIYFNPAAVEFSGRTPQLGTDRWCVTWKLYYPDGTPMPHDKCPMAVALQEGRIIRGAQAIAERPDGKRIWFEPYPAPLRDEHGSTVGGINLLVDITPRKESEAALRRSERELSDFFENAVVGLHCVGADGIILRANQAELDLLGYTRDEYVGRHIAEFHVDENVISDILRRLMNRETLHSYETRLRCKDGSTKHVLLSSNALWEDGQFVHTRCFTRDITERHQADEALRESRQQLADELAATQALQNVSSKMIRGGDDQVLYEAIMDAAVAIMHSDFASMQMLYPERGSRGELKLLASRGFSPLAVQFWEWVRTDSHCTCGTAMRTGNRAIATDVRTCDFMAGSEDRTAYLQAGLLAAQSTPLVSRSGKLLGMISTHWKQPHEPSERDLRLLDILARQAADLIERANEEQRKSAELQAIARLHEVGNLCLRSDAPFDQCLQEIVGAAIEITRADKGNIQLLDASKGELTIAAQRGFEKPFLDFYTSVSVGDASACGTALRTGGRIVVEDVTKSEIFARQNSMIVLLDAGVRAVQSTPLISSTGGALGMISTHFARPYRLSERELRLIDLLARQAADFLERRRGEEALRHANHAKDQFLAVLSHELRTPLTPVLMTVAAMEFNPDLSPPLRDDVKMIRRNIELQSKLIDDLLDLSRITTGKLRLNFGPLEINELLRHVCETCGSNIREKGIRLHCDLGQNVCQVAADPARLQQVFWNLLINAAKFTPHNGEISITTENVGDDFDRQVRVTVRDTGKGIAPEILPRIFDAFEQGEAGVTRQFGGLGLGLAISKRLIDHHHGTIRAQSDGPNKGATFTVELPALPHEPMESAPERTHAGGNECAAPLRLLVVEDHPDTVVVLGKLLSASGNHVRTATSAGAALKLASELPFDIIISDIGLPDMTGYELMKRIREKHPIMGIAMSGYGMEEDIKMGEQAGFSDHLVKPVKLAQLEQSIRRVAENGRKGGANGGARL